MLTQGSATSDGSFEIHNDDVQIKDAGLTLQSYRKTFRVRGIPHTCKRNETGKIIKVALGLEQEGQDLKVCSLALNPYRQEHEKVATVSFASVPRVLSNSVGKDQWQFPLHGFDYHQVSDEDEEDTPRREAELVIDTHFKGFTPLRSFRNASDYQVEYVVFLYCSRRRTDFYSCIAISGLGGHSFGSFKERGGSHMWLRDSLPYDLPLARILIYGYDARLEGSQSFQDVRTLAGQFRNQIKAIRGQVAVSLPYMRETSTKHTTGRSAAEASAVHCPQSWWAYCERGTRSLL